MGKVSDEIKQFLDFIRDAEARYVMSQEVVKTEESRTQDLLHAIEFESECSNLDGLTERLRKCRIERRENKDIVEELEPIIDFLGVQSNKKTMDQLTQLLGKIRKVEKYHENRSYHPRVEEQV